MTFIDYLAKTRLIAVEEKDILDDLHQKIIFNGSLDGIQNKADSR